MTTEAQRRAWSVDLDAARQRAEDAEYHGDRAGQMIALADARAIAARLRRAFMADGAERQAARPDQAHENRDGSWSPSALETRRLAAIDARWTERAR